MSSCFGTSCAGAASQGAVLGLLNPGAADRHLTYAPEISFFRFRYKQYFNFAMENIEQPFTGNVAFGSDVQLTLNRNGDLIYYQYVVIDLPGIMAVTNENGTCGVGSVQFPVCDNCDPTDDGEPTDGCTCCETEPPEADPDPLPIDGHDPCSGLTLPWAHYTNAIGQFLIKKACFVVAGKVITNLYNDFLNCWEELAGRPGARLQEMIGKRYTRAQLVADSKENRRLYVPLPWSWSTFQGNAFNMVGMMFHGAQVMVTFEELVKCVQVSGADVLVLKCGNCTPLVATDLAARLETCYIHLEEQERNMFAAGNYDQLITQVQVASLCGKLCDINLNLNYNCPVVELIFFVRRQKNSACNNHFNYSGKWGRDPIAEVALTLNNLPRFATREGRYFRLVTAYQAHTLIPDSFVYCYSFALQPESPQPTGSLNFSKIDTACLHLKLQEELQDETVQAVCFARSLNFLSYKKGVVSTLFAS